MQNLFQKLLISNFLILCTTPAYAQIVPDQTLSSEASRLTPNVLIKNTLSDRIDGGATRGSNLFHSFSQFNIGDGQRVYFSNPSGVQNIFTRVTGGNASSILGTLGVDGGANLFLINPNGILFGRNASLDVGGSFVGTTASSLKFADGNEFIATKEQTSPLLTISVPIGLQFGNLQPGAIVNAGNLAVMPGSNLSLIGGTVAVTGNIVAPGGEINIAAVPDNSLVEINNQGNLSSISRVITENIATNTSSLPELLQNYPITNTGLTFITNNQVSLETNGITVPVDAGTAIISGILDASNYQSGKTGGVIRVLGSHVGLFNPTTVNVSGDAGGGTVIIGGNASAENKLINATKTFVDNNVSINTDAISQGNGGNVLIGSDDITRFFGSISTRGAVIPGNDKWKYTTTGNSGNVEITGKNGLVFDGFVNTYVPDGTYPTDNPNIYTVGNKSGTLRLVFPELTIVDTPIVEKEPSTTYSTSAFSNLDNNQNVISWNAIADNLKSTNLTFSSNSNVEIAPMVNNTVQIKYVNRDYYYLSKFGIDANSSIRFLDTKNTLIATSVFIDWKARGDILTGAIKTNRYVGTRAGNIFLTSTAGKIDTSAGILDASTFDNGYYSSVAGRVKLEAYGDIITQDINTVTRNLESENIILKSIAGGINTSAGTLDARGNYLAPKQYSNGGSVTLDAYGKIQTGNIYTNGNAGGQIDITSRHDGIDTTSGKLTTYGRYGSVGDININAYGNIYAGNIDTSYTSNERFNTRTGKSIPNPRGGSINIQGEKFFLNGYSVSASANGIGSGGKISIFTSKGINIENGGVISTEVEPKAGGDGGEINLTTNGNLLLANGARIINNTNGQGDAGRVSITALGGVSLTNKSQISTAVASGAIGNGREINIETSGQLLLDNSAITANTNGRGNAAALGITAKGDVNISNGSQISTAVAQSANGNGGEINIKTLGQFLLDNSAITANTAGTGNAAKVTLDAKNGIIIGGSQINTQVLPYSVGTGGDINLRTDGKLSLINGSQLTTNTSTKGDAGNINITASNAVNVSGEDASGNRSGLLTNTSGAGAGGNILIDTKDLSISDGGIFNTQTTSQGNGGSITANADQIAVTNGGQLTSSTLGSGRSGNITVNANKSTSIVGTFNRSTVANSGINSAILTETQGTGVGGELKINTSDLEVLGSAQVSAATAGKAPGGNLTVNASDSVKVSGDNSRLISDTSGEKNAGDLTINTARMNVEKGGFISASTSGQGQGGNLNIAATEFVELNDSGSGLFANTQAGSLGNGGTIEINTKHLSINNGAGIGINSNGQGSAGRFLNINARDSITLANSSITSGLNTKAVGQGGTINLTASNLSLTDGAKVVASTSGQGNAGRINAQVKDRVSLTNNSQIQSTVESGAVGQGGEINLNASELSLTDGAKVVASTSGQGNAGNINIDAPNGSVSISDSSGLLTQTNSDTGKGGIIAVTTKGFEISNGAALNATTNSASDGGSVIINANTFNAVSGGKVLTTTSGSGDAGNISVNLSDRFFLSGAGTGLFANTESGSSGNGGSIFIQPKTVLIEDGAGVTVGSRGTGIGGNIQIQADSLKLDRRAFLSAETASSQGGNIGIKSQGLLLLRRNSQISTSAGTGEAGGDGGNIIINSPLSFIIAVPNENSDITANAFTGKGGRVLINASGIFGTQFREKETPKSDITASSDFGLDGTVQIDTLGIDPSQGLINLPTEPVEPKVVSGCTAGPSQNQSRFVVTGRGGLPPNPREAFNSDAVRVDWVTLNSDSNNRRSQTVTTTIPTSAPIVEATGLAINAKGEVLLTAEPSTATVHSSWQTPTTCSVPASKH